MTHLLPTKRPLKILSGMYLIVLLTLTHLPHLGPIPEVPGKDKTLHFLAYSLAAGLILLAWIQKRSVRPVAGVIAGLLILGALDEITQPSFSRTCDFFDWLADAAGIFFGTTAWLLVAARRRKEAT